MSDGPTPALFGMRTAEAARYLGVSRGTIRRWADVGVLECHWTPGGQRRFTIRQLERVVRSGHVKPVDAVQR